jgi:general secretion pathway protein D
MKKIAVFILIFLLIYSAPVTFSFGQENNQGATVKDYLKEVLPLQEGRRIVLDETTGVLTITDTPSNHKLIKRLIEQWDIGPQQIRIEARFVEIKEEALQEIGFEWWARKTGDDIYYGPGPTLPTAPVAGERPPVYQSIEPGSSTTGYHTYGSRARPPWTGVEMGAPAEVSGLGLWIGDTNVDGTELFAYLRALEGKNKANLLSAPKVTTLSGQTANIELANTIPYASDYELTDTDDEDIGQFETYSIEEKKTGIFLEVTPTVGRGSNIITLEIHPEVSEITHQVDISSSTVFPETLGWPVVETRSTQTTVTIRSGQTIAIGGLIKDDEVTTKRKIPLLGDVPLLGNLFRWENTNRTKKNLVVFLTATLIKPDGTEVK